MLPYYVSVKKRDGTMPPFNELRGKCVGDSRLARARQPREENGETSEKLALRPRAKHGKKFGEGEPFGKQFFVPQPATHLRPRDRYRRLFSPKARYIYVARDGRDVVWSLYNHHASANATYYRTVNDTPGRVGPPLEPPPASVRQYYHDWLDKDGHPYWPFWDNIKSWWDIRHLPNVILFHFAKLKEDTPGQIRRLAAYLEIPIDESKWELILYHCSFEFMKRHATRSVPLGGAFWDKGAETFFHRGTNGRWRDALSREESEKYEKMALEKLGEACAHWLATGELPD